MIKSLPPQRKSLLQAAFIIIGMTSLCFLSVSAEAGSAKKLLTCNFEQVLHFADDTSDYPSGPAYFGSAQPLVARKPDNYKFTDTEVDVINNANDMVKQYQGAQFTVDLRDGTLKSIPFGAKKILIVESDRNSTLKPLVLSRDRNRLYGGDAFI